MLFQLRANTFTSLAHQTGEFDFNKEAYTKTNKTTKQKVTPLLCYFPPTRRNQLLAVHSFKGSHAFGTLEKSHCAVLTQAEETFCLWLYLMLDSLTRTAAKITFTVPSVFFPADIHSWKCLSLSSEWGSHPLLQCLLSCVFPVPWRMILQIPRGISWNSDAPRRSSGILKPKVCTFSLSIPSFLGCLTNLCISALKSLLGVTKFPQSAGTAQAPLLLNAKLPQDTRRLDMATHPSGD